MSSLFKVPILTGGLFDCSKVSENVYLLSFASPADNRVTRAFLFSFLLALDILERRYPKGVLITTSSIPKFYSNGFDLDDLSGNPPFYENYLLPVLRRILTYPMPTIALINGHAFGAGFFLALAHDYSIQNPSRGYMCLPEIDLGLVIPSSIVVMIKSKLPSSQLYRDAAIEGRRYTGPESLKSGIVDALGGLNEALKLIDERKLISKTASGALAGLKEDLWREVLHAFKNQQENVEWRNAIDQEKIEFQQKTEEKVAEWEKKPKL